MQPNGLAFSPDESLLYIVDTGAHARRRRAAPRAALPASAPTARSRGGEVFATCPVGPVRRPARRRARQPVAERRRRRALPRARRHAARQDADPRDRRQPVLRRRRSATGCSSARRPRCTRSTSTPKVGERAPAESPRRGSAPTRVAGAGRPTPRSSSRSAGRTAVAGSASRRPARLKPGLASAPGAAGLRAPGTGARRRSPCCPRPRPRRRA